MTVDDSVAPGTFDPEWSYSIPRDQIEGPIWMQDCDLYRAGGRL